MRDVCWRGISYDRASARLSVCLSVTSRYCIETAKRLELVFGAETTLGLSYIVS